MDVRLLGPVRLLRDGHPVSLGGAKQRAVLALLALEAPRAVSLDSIVDGIWGDAPPTTARNAVQVYVSGLRRALAGDDARIERSGETYRLVGPGVRTDLGLFTEQVAAGRSALRSMAPQRAADLLDAALGSWDGLPFGGLEGLPLHARARRLVEDARATTQAELVDALLRIARPGDAAAVARDLVSERPLDEHGWALLATAQYHSGQQGDALATCRRLRALLAEELGVDPSPMIVELEATILAQALAPPWLAADTTGGLDKASEGAAAPTRTTLPALPLVALARDLAGHVASYTGESEVALEATLAGITDARRAGDRFDLVNLLASAAESLVELGRGVEAVDITDEAFELTRGLDVGPVVAHVLMMRGLALTQVERVREARGCLIEALRISQDRYPDRLIVGAILTTLAVAAATEGDDVGAARLWGSGDAVFADEGAVPASRAGAFLKSSLEAVSGRLGAERTATLQAIGAADPDDVVARLLGAA
nr:AfsR/SARP family transcriptional regulator [Terrabacter sp. MAHUQ-38]